MKAILSLIVSGALVASGLGQTRNVLVGTNNAVVQPTNFWSADASNARTGLELGTAATNDATAFQPSSVTLSNLATNNGATLTNLAASNIAGTLNLGQGGTGATNASNARTALGLGTAATNPVSAFQASSLVLSNLAISNGGALTNITAANIVGVISGSNLPPFSFTNFSGTLTIAQGGTSATNAANARANLGSTTVGDALFIATNAAAARTAIGALATNGDATNLTNFPATLLRATGSAAGLTNFPTVALASNVTGIIAISNGGSGATTADGARTNLGLGATNNIVFNSLHAEQDASNGIYTLSIGQTNTGFRGVGGGPNDFVFARNGTNVLGLTSGNIQSFVGHSFSAPLTLNYGAGSTSVISFAGIDSAIGAAISRTNLGLGATWLTNTNVTNFRTAIGLGTNAQPVFDGALITGDLFAGSLEVASGSNSTAVTTNGIEFTGDNAATTRTNLGLGWSALTNTNAGIGLVSVNTNGDVVSPTNFWQRAPIQTAVQDFTGITVNQTNNATNARNVYIYSLATNVSGISNTIILPTNTLTFNGDEVTVIHKGTTNTTTVVRQAGSTNNLITLNRFDESVKFIRELGQWDFYHNISFVEPIQFSGTNAAANAAASRTNLGLGITNEVQFGSVFVNGVFNTLSNAVEIYQPLWIGDRDSTNAVFQFETSSDASIARTNLGLGLPAITNTNVTNFRTAIGLGVTNAVEFGSVGAVTASISDTFSVNIIDVESGGYIQFSGENEKSATRTNLGLGATWLTNTSVTNFQKAIFYTNTAPSNIGGNLGTIAAWIEIVASNGVTYKIPAYTNVP